MKTDVHILVSCVNPSLWDINTLVFKTLRTGFPTANIYLYANNLTTKQNERLSTLVDYSSYKIRSLKHDEWIRHLIETQENPFWICDADVVFWNSIEDWQFIASIAGRGEPAFIEPLTKTIHMSRFQTGLLWIDPIKVRSNIEGWNNCFPKDFVATVPDKDLIKPLYIPGPRGTYLYDTLVRYMQAFTGQSFTNEQNQAFEHLNCGTYVDLYGPAIGEPGMEDLYHRIANDVTIAKGLWAEQLVWFRKHSV